MKTIKNTFLKSCLFILAGLLFGCTKPETISTGMALKNFKILTLENDEVLLNHILIIDNDYILDLISEREFNANYNLPDSLIVDGKGKYLMPSFQDMHVHFQPNNPSHKMYLKHFLGYGITQVRVMAGSEDLLAWKDSIQEGLLTGPELKVAGPLIDGVEPLWGSAHTGPVVAHIADIDAIVASQKEKGYDLIKLYERLSKEVYQEFLSTALKHNIKVAGHLPYSLVHNANLNEIFNENSPGFEHLKNFGALLTNQNVALVEQPNDLEYYGREMSKDLNSEKIKEVVKSINQHNIWICPTSVLWRNTSDSLRSAEVAGNEAFLRLDSGLKNWWLSIDLPTNENEAFLTESLLKEMAAQNTKVLAGTDFPNPFLIPGYSLHQEIHSFVSMGYSNLEALRSATTYPAEYWNETGSNGIINKGSKANFIILHKNPLTDIANTLAIEKVMHRGRFLYPEELLIGVDKPKKI